MEKKDSILSALFMKVRRHPEPHDHPTASHEIAKEVNLPLGHVLSLSNELAEEGLLAISHINEPPLLYLTKSGVARARRQSI
ncbi:hypothetical protein [Rufibacter sp. XAAS-G3-1]|uniref:hypothetical protein n=1 Tax=Rufibacter sp. XAAS-G3-1 TaxID=2729134 RepID=UPI0015E68EDE|nr:hypothetical protein [Rufibacter sp. XAAS-G3-1]